ncbi:helix-turn-helix domain-containing protein [Clostridium amazonitimonense]|uniref:helix-turn-helix domain-containing protein n=1 Tax=Clostridium amazonitimonense TaxID=1499689 RepID=UPI000509D503|nr:helix-turn-helix domain-containing protein [Clostridium amazonitimonense]
MDNQFYTIDKIAEILGMHHKTIRKFITEGKLGANKVGKQWRISGHDLSVFMEKNNVNIKTKDTSEEENIDFSTSNGEVDTVKQKVNVSTVVDMNEINKDEYMRISNMLIAIMNAKDSRMANSTINMKYYEKENRLRIMLWGGIKFTEEMMSTISILVEQRDL